MANKKAAKAVAATAAAQGSKKSRKGKKTGLTLALAAVLGAGFAAVMKERQLPESPIMPYRDYAPSPTKAASADKPLAFRNSSAKAAAPAAAAVVADETPVVAGFSAIPDNVEEGKSGSHPPLKDPQEMPEGYPIKGNAGSMLYHVPGSPFYSRTVAEIWFATEADAKAAGYKLPKSQRN